MSEDLVGWWHPSECVNQHDEGGNCLDDDGFIVGWRDPVPASIDVERLARAILVTGDPEGYGWIESLGNFRVYAEAIAREYALLGQETTR